VAGAFRGGFGAYPDEPAHYVTGLMVRDYIAQFFPGPPIEFARNYYLHYPQVAFGHWPPMFYVLQALWTMVAPISYPSMLLLMAALTSAAAATLDSLMQEDGLLAGVLFVALPITQAYASSLMAEAPLVLFSLLSLAALIRFLETETLSGAVLFGLLASAAILTKASGWAIAMVPVFSLLLMRSPRRLLSPRLWVSGLIVAVLCVPYYFLTLQMLRAGMEGRSIGWTGFWNALIEYFEAIPFTVGIALTVLAICGLAVKALIPFWRGTLTLRWAVIASFCPAVLLFHSVVPTATEPRKAIMAMPMIVLFAVAGARWLARWKWLRGAALVGVLAGGAFAIAHREPTGRTAAAEFVMARPEWRSSVCLVSLRVPGAEGSFIAEVASRESLRPTRFVLRASKQLMRSTWNGLDYRPLFETPGQMRIALDQIPVGLLAIDREPSPEMKPHERTLRQMLETYGAEWETIYSASDITIYRRKKDLSRQPIRFEVDLTRTLGGSLRQGEP
jgi:hypothetical protein